MDETRVRRVPAACKPDTMTRVDQVLRSDELLGPMTPQARAAIREGVQGSEHQKLNNAAA